MKDTFFAAANALDDGVAIGSTALEFLFLMEVFVQRLVADIDGTALFLRHALAHAKCGLYVQVNIASVDPANVGAVWFPLQAGLIRRVRTPTPMCRVEWTAFSDAQEVTLPGL